MPPPTTAVVILNWNTRSLLEKFLPSVIKNSILPGVEIVVADNGSNDGSSQLIREEFPGVRLIQLDKNYGFAGGYNRALKEIDATFSVLLNSDVEPAPGWLQYLIEHMTQHPETAACVPKIKDLKNRIAFEYAGAAGGFIDKWGYTFCRGRLFDVLEEDHHQYEKPGQIFWGSGAALMVRTQLFNSSQGLNEEFFAHMEEIDWCWRMKNQGHQIWYSPKSEVFHMGGGTLNAISPHKTYLNFRNNLFMLYRNLPANGFRHTIFIRLLLDGLAAARFLMAGKWAFLKAIYRAHKTFFQRLPQLKNERNDLMKKVVKDNHSEIYSKSIVIDYFLKGRRKFTDLPFNP